MISLYTATVPAFRQIVDAATKVVAKGEAFAAEQGIDPATLIEARLFSDMLPFAYQIYSVANHSVGAFAGVRAGVFSPFRGPFPDSFAGLQALLADTAAELEGVDPAQVDGFIGREMAFVIGDLRVPYLAEDFLLSFSLPNFYFHAATAYDILRAQGVVLGKRDYLGRPRFRA